MRGAVMYGPGEVRVEERDEPRLVEATDAIIRVSAACVCGSDLWPYRGVEELAWPAQMGHEYVGIVEEVGAEVEAIKPGQFVVGSFWGSDNTCEICRAGYQSACVNLVATPEVSSGRSDSEPAGGLRCARDRLVRRGGCRSRPGQDGRRRRRRG